eukprot:scaffold432399_cov23-Prasinocladus_malaysianus.AAC.1
MPFRQNKDVGKLMNPECTIRQNHYPLKPAVVNAGMLRLHAALDVHPGKMLHMQTGIDAFSHCNEAGS